MKCINCKKEIPDSAKVCGYCGTKQTPPVKPKKAAPPPKPKKTTTPAEKGAPKWLLPAVFAVLAVIAVVLVWKFVLSPSPVAEAPAPEAPSKESAPKPTIPEKTVSEPISEPAAPESVETETPDEQAPLQEPVNCWDQKTIEADRGFQLKISWFTDTEEQALHFIQVENFKISVNGELTEFSKVKGPFPHTFEDQNGNEQEGYASDYLSDILNLPEGTHSVSGKISFLEAHFDGIYWYGSGQDYEVQPIECELIAE